MVLIEIVDRLPTRSRATGSLRLGTRAGLTNPLCFQVGACRKSASRSRKTRVTPAAPELKAPFLINGQIMPGDVDRFRFQAQRGRSW